MRTLNLQVQISVDGFMDGPTSELDQPSTPWSDDVYAYVNTLNESVDCILLGRKTAEGFIPAWESRPAGEPEALIDAMVNTPKVVISNTLAESPWPNAVVVGGDLVEAINRLKAQPGGNLIVYGGGTLVSSLLAADLVDDLYLFVNPFAYGTGMAVFGEQNRRRRLRRVDVHPFECGITAMHYQPARA